MQEKKRWEEWDKKDYQIELSRFDSLTIQDSLTMAISKDELCIQEKKENHVRHLARRVKAHEKLLLHAYTALSFPSIKGINKKVKQAISISKAKNKPSPANQFPFPKTKSTLLYRQILERFCANIKSNSIEVLKLNRENKWQSRYLTVSKVSDTGSVNNKDDSASEIENYIVNISTSIPNEKLTVNQILDFKLYHRRVLGSNIIELLVIVDFVHLVSCG